LTDRLDYPDLIAGLTEPDDAAVWRLDDDRALVVTTDFFTPIVDDPYDYGAIAAANSLSDVYAMGAKPFLALNVAAFPPDLPTEILGKILLGGSDKAREAGVIIAGGHTIQDKEPKYGLIALGFGHPDRILTKGGAKPGDILLLSKPLGTGTIATALKQEKADPAYVQKAVDWMKKLNAEAAEAALGMGAHAATDITGFSLLGHAWEMALASKVSMEIEFSKLPFLEGARSYAKQWIFPGGAFDNREYYQSHVKFEKDLPEEYQMLLFGPQTSGGLLVAVGEKRYDEFKKNQSLQRIFWEIGRVVEGKKIIIV